MRSRWTRLQRRSSAFRLGQRHQLYITLCGYGKGDEVVVCLVVSIGRVRGVCRMTICMLYSVYLICV